MAVFVIQDARRDHLLTEQVMTQTFLGFCLSQLCMFLHTANRLWRLGACREGQLHSDTWRRDGGVGTEREEDEMARQRGRDAEERGGRTLATVARMSHLTETRQLLGGHFGQDESTLPCQMVAVSPAGVCWSLIKKSQSLFCFLRGDSKKTFRPRIHYFFPYLKHKDSLLLQMHPF